MKKVNFLFLLCFCAVFTSAQNEKFDSIANHVDRNGFFQYQKSRDLIDTLCQMAHHSSDSLRLLALCLSEEGKLYSSHSIIDTLLESRINACLLQLDSVQHVRERNILEYTLGLHYYGMESYGEAFIKALQALEKFESIQDSLYIFKTLGLLGKICYNINQPLLCNAYYTKQLDYIEKDKFEYFRTQQNRYIFFAQKGEFDKFIDSVKYLTKEAKKVLPDYQMISLYLNLSNAYSMIDSLDIAYGYLLKSQETMQQIDNNNLQVALYAYFADYFSEIEDYRQALEYYRLAHRQSVENDKASFSRIIYWGLAFCYEELNEKDSAIFYLKRYRDATLQEEQQNKAVEVYQQYISNYLELTENQLALAEQAVLLKNRQLTIIVISAVFAVFLAMAVWVVMRQRRRQKATERKAAEAALKQQEAHQKKIAALERKQEKELIEAQQRELLSYSTLLSNKIEMMEKTLKLTAQIKERKDDAVLLAEEIEALIHKERQFYNEWSKFRVLLEKMHPDFFDNLKDLAPSLTKENLRVCAYVKIGLSVKESALLLNIEPQSVSNQRNRIKKKLGLSDEDDLGIFLETV